MFYLLNFNNHQFITCDNASVVEAKIRGLLASGCSKDSLEIVDAYGDESRMQIDAFRAMCKEQGWVDNSIVDFLVEREGERKHASETVQREESSISLWGRLGISLNVTPEELVVLKRGGKEGEALLVDLVRSERCAMSGDTYFPEECNEEYMRDMEEEFSFDLSEEPLYDNGKVLASIDRATVLQNGEIVVRLSREEWEKVVDAMEYAVDDRRYEAEQTRDPADRAEIEAGADSWDKIRDVIGAAVQHEYEVKYNDKAPAPSLASVISNAEKLVSPAMQGNDAPERERE